MLKKGDMRPSVYLLQNSEMFENEIKINKNVMLSIKKGLMFKC